MIFGNPSPLYIEEVDGDCPEFKSDLSANNTIRRLMVNIRQNGTLTHHPGGYGAAPCDINHAIIGSSREEV